MNQELFNKEMAKIRSYPHKYIMDWMEENLIYIGSRVFEVLALQPCSLILPDIPFLSSSIRAQLNILLISSPSTGKTSICKKYENFAYHPYRIKKVTSAKLIRDIEEHELFTLIVDDFSQIGSDYDIIKIVEGALGDEKTVLKRTMREEVEIPTRGVGLICGTWSDLFRYIRNLEGGLLFRSFLILIRLKKNQKLDIGRHINNNIGKEEKSENSMFKESVIKKFYEELFWIQRDKPIRGYNLTEELRYSINDAWRKIIESLPEFLEAVFTRELQEAYRILISSAFLNIHNRKVEKGILYPNEEDLALAKKLMLDNIRRKLNLIKALLDSSISGRARTILRRVSERNKETY